MSANQPSEQPRIGVIHPGQMGITVAAALHGAGHDVAWASEGRSAASRERAHALDLVDAGSLEALVERSTVVVSVCPPHAAGALAAEVAGCAFRGTYVDANAVSPETARAIANVVEAAGASYVDGGIIGPPARRAGTTRLYLSGPGAPAVASLFEHGAFDARAIDGGAGAASALKVCYAAWTKNTSALLLAIRALARAEAVEEALLAEWALSVPELEERSTRAGSAAAAKAWRFVAEMRESAAAMEARGLPGGFGHAAAEVYERLAPLKDRKVDLDEALALLEARAMASDAGKR